MAKYEHINGTNDDSFSPESRTQLKIRTVNSFTIIVNDEIKAPSNTNSRTASVTLEAGDKYELITKGKWSINLALLPENQDTNNGEDLLQEDEPLTMYEKLAQQMAQKFEAQINADETESIDEANDFSEDDEEYHNPLSKHEAQLMVNEYLAEEKQLADNQAILDKELIKSSKDENLVTTPTNSEEHKNTSESDLTKSSPA